MLRIHDVVFDEVEHPVTVVVIATDAGSIAIMGAIRACGDALFIVGAHIHSDAGANRLGIATLRAIAHHVMETLGYATLRVKGAPRTTGASPGHQPKLRFARDTHPACTIKGA